MKTNLLKSIFISLILVMGVSNAWAYNYGGTNVYYYFANTGNWPTPDLYIWNGDWNTHFTLTQIANTKVYYHKWTSAYNNNAGILFRGEVGWSKGQTGDIYANYTSHTSWVHNSTTGKTDLSNINRSAQVAVKLSTGGDYTQTANANCVAKVSGHTIEKGNSSATAKNASTSGSSATASISAAYGSTITYTATAGTGYTFKGFSTSSSTSLPASLSASGKTVTASAYGSSNNSTYYAYFKANQYTVKFDANGGTGSMSDQSHTYSVSQALTANAFIRAGYTFEGWNAKADGTGTSYTDKQSVSNLSSTDGATVTLYAQWEKLPANIHNITYTAQAIGWTYGARPASAEEGSTVTFEVNPATGYTVTVTSSDVSLSKNDNTYTFTMPTKDVTINVSATENTHDVTISYKSGGVILQADVTINVSEANAKSIEAPAVSGYAFTGWTLGTGIINKSANTTTNPISITTKASGAYTLTANYEKERCVYFVNTARWTTIKAYAWNDSGNNGWPGANMTISEQIGGYDVYKYVMPAGKNFDKIIFNNKVGDNGEQTGDLEWINGKYYVYSAGQWVDKNEVADLLPKPVIYFKNHLGWTNVYVYFFNAENWGDNGASPWDLSVTNGRVCKMEKVGETDIYKFDYSGKDFVPSNVIAFSKDDQSGYGNFHGTEAVYRTDYNPSMELYIPQKTSSETKNSTKYFNKGLWMKYNSTESGYELAGTMLDKDWKVYEPFTASAPGSYHFDIALSLSGNHTYEFQVKNIKNDWYGKQNTKINATKNDLVLEQGSGDTYNIKLTTTSAGNYIFSIDLSEGTMKVSVEYPLQVNDYRMVYIESETKDTKTYTKFHPAQSIRYQAEGEKKDTVSFYINKTAGKNPAILLQKCTAISGANFTWEDVAIQYINGNGGADPALAQAPARKAASITYVDGCTAVTGNGVYNFVMQQTNGSAAFVTGATHPYTGNYYIRTDGAEGGWRKYNTNPDNIMTHSETALTHGGYDYYFCEWMIKDNNVKYVVANDYNYCVSDTLAKDDIVTDENGNLPANANVRYTWNSSTNALKRAYINGSSTIADRYLVLEGNEHLKDASGNSFNSNKANFKDMGNWLYQVDVKANEETLVKLSANYNGTIQYFKGDADPDSVVNIITGATNHYKFRLIYDFKTNYLLCGLIEDGNIDETITVDEAMISRSHHNQAQTFQVASGKSITTIKTVYGVMNFNKSTLNGAGSEHERALYWVSFPFDVDLGKAFGFGNYGEHWIMEYYDGEARAKNGWWADSDTYWEYIWNPKGYTLEAGKGYVLCLDLDLLKESASLWKNTDDIALYFPSKAENITINDKPVLKDTEVKPLTCTIERDDRKTKDSNWNIIGVPAYTNFPDIDTKDIGFYYEYDKSNDEYAVNNAAVFDCMHAYMVQFAGSIEWAYNRVAPAIAARRNAAGKDQYTLRLALQQEGTDHDHTFIRLQEDKATAEFDMNYDLCKIINRGANIYSMIGNVEVAANVLPVEECVIPVGLDIEEDGNYTFAMPDGTDGITAILIDYETGKETNLLLADYTVELNAGIDNERFALRLRPSYVATEVENTILTDGNDNVKKYIIDGALYLLRDGKLYDAQGRMIQQ